jgi:hypothetical protein
MQFINIILFILRYGLPFVSLISEIWDLIKKLKGQDPASAIEAKANLSSAMEVCKVSGSLEPLRQLCNELTQTYKTQKAG